MQNQRQSPDRHGLFRRPEIHRPSPADIGPPAGQPFLQHPVILWNSMFILPWNTCEYSAWCISVCVSNLSDARNRKPEKSLRPGLVLRIRAILQLRLILGIMEERANRQPLEIRILSTLNWNFNSSDRPLDSVTNMQYWQEVTTSALTHFCKTVPEQCVCGRARYPAAYD